jgi:molybdate transport system regulatory protein
MAKKRHQVIKASPRWRICVGEDIAVGPGKVELLALVGETGSITQAARRMEMSYMRAWTLLKTMNRCFDEPLVEAVRGGKSGGGAKLTQSGRRLLALCHQLDCDSLRATRKTREQILALLHR